MSNSIFTHYSQAMVIGSVIFCLLFPVMSVVMAKDYAAVYKFEINKPLSEVYDAVYKNLEEARFFVVFEPNIGANLSRFAEKWGEDYNQNKLSQIRSMVFCNAWYANQVSNQDPDMLGFCPLHISLIERDKKTTILFNRPGVMAAGSPAQILMREIESEVIAAIELAGKQK